MRKQLITLMLLFGYCFSLTAQDSSFLIYKGKPNLMADFTINYSTSGFSGGQSIMVMLQKFGVAFSFKGAEQKAANLPDDYRGGGWFGNSKPKDNDLYWALQYVKPITIKPYKTFLLLHVGPSLSMQTLHSFKPRSGGFGFSFGSNYDVIENKTFSTGLSAEAKLLSVIFKKLAVECTAFGNINTVRSMAGVGVGIAID